MEREIQTLLKDGILKIDNSLYSEELFNRLCVLYDQISLFNPAYGLVNATGSEIVIKHILDCLSPAMIFRSFSDSATSFADLGSGSGLPGLVLASLFPENRFTLIERMGRRCNFLRSTSVLMGLKNNVVIEESDLSTVREKFDIVTFRAFRPICDIAEDLDRITSEGSRICIYKSSIENSDEEIASMEKYSKGLFEAAVSDCSVPFLNAKRSLLVFKKNVR